MSPPPPQDLSSLSMLELFRIEVEAQTGLLTSGLLELERLPAQPEGFESLMRAAHSLKGAARIIQLPGAVALAHAMEDCFVAAQQGRLRLEHSEIDWLLRGVDLLSHLARCTESGLSSWESQHADQLQAFLAAAAQLSGPPAGPNPSPPQPAAAPEPLLPPDAPASGSVPVVSDYEALTPSLAPRHVESPERILRLTAENLNRLLGLAGESLVESRWLGPFAESLQRLKRQHLELAQKLERLRQAWPQAQPAPQSQRYLAELSQQLAETQEFLSQRLQELDIFDRRASQLSQRLYLEVLRTRMRPFSEGVRRFPRLVRDLARTLDKEVRLELYGETTQVDRDILERLETPLAHLLRNAVDHGCEQRSQRLGASKPAELTIRLEARHSAGMLLVTVSDDGAGVNLELLRQAIVQKRLASPTQARQLSEQELLEFLFLPGFTLKPTVTEISGRGFGLDVVQNMVRSVRGAIRLSNQPGRGLRVQLQLPLTLSVLRALLVEVAGEPYAIPLNQIVHTLKLHRSQLQSVEGRWLFHFAQQPLNLLSAHQVLECAQPAQPQEELPVVVLGERNSRFGLVVDQLLGQRELVVQPLDERLGKVRDISSAALMEDGSPVLILEVDELLGSIEKVLAEGRLSWPARPEPTPSPPRPKRVLAADDSLTVRELVRKLLSSHGYQAELAVDGLEAWNAVRASAFDLVITDVDMPRMGGIELARLIKSDPKLQHLPVLIVSYKDQDQERLRGLEAGADFYLTKSSFHDESLLRMVQQLLGEPPG